MRDDSITPGVKDVTKQMRDPQSPGSRGLKHQVTHKLANHSMRDLLDLVDKMENKSREDQQHEN